MSSLVGNPEFNVRVFRFGESASLLAAAEWLGASQLLAEVAWYALLENCPDAHPYSVTIIRGSGGRVALGGSCAELEQAFPESAPPGGELRLALDAASRNAATPSTPLVMGILNVTPDSFSDGGLWVDAERAVQRGLEMVEEGADVLDIGGESTRPGAEEVPEEEELRRILPVVTSLRSRTKALLSVDTRKSSVARACLEAGADWINDVSGLTYDPALADVVAGYPEAKLVLMHCRARPSDERYSTEWDEAGRPVYEDVVADSMRWLRTQARVALSRGVRPEQLWIDPGFGFGKTYEQNLDVLRRLREYTSMGLPILVGTSRKSSVGKLVGDLPADQRLEGTAATVAWALAEGASAVRVHEVREMARVTRATHALRSG
jgi:dihydropteroate synthase